MYLPLILFLISLAGIVIMIGRKLILQRAGVQLENKEEFLFEIPHPEEIKYVTVKSAKKYGYITLVTTLKLYVKSMNVAKWSLKEMIDMIDTINRKYILRSKPGENEKKVSTFLKTMSEYKDKIAEIKYKIHEEEENK